jgi:hypothetical protein
MTRNFWVSIAIGLIFVALGLWQIAMAEGAYRWSVRVQGWWENHGPRWWRRSQQWVKQSPLGRFFYSRRYIVWTYRGAGGLFTGLGVVVAVFVCSSHGR